MNTAAIVPRFNLRFGLKGLIFLMAAVALGAAAFRDASQVWMTICTSAALIFIFFAIIAALYGRRDRQAFWTGFAIFAAAYFFFVVRFNDSDIVAKLATTKAIGFITDETHPYMTPENLGLPRPQTSLLHPATPHSTAGSGTRERLAMSAFYNLAFLQADYFDMRVGDDVKNGIIIEQRTPIIGHSQFSLALGLFGGLLAQGFAAGKSRNNAGFQSLSKGDFDAAV